MAGCKLLWGLVGRKRIIRPCSILYHELLQLLLLFVYTRSRLYVAALFSTSSVASIRFDIQY
jgi:hypothetical protein